MSGYKFAVSGGLPAFPMATVFVDKYMPEANATFVKVYLYGLRLCYSPDKQINNKNIAEALGILESDVVLAWKYWEEQGIIKQNDGIEFVDLTLTNTKPEKPAKPTYKAREMAIAVANNPDVALLVEHAENIFGKTLSTSETSTLYSFYDWLGLPAEVVLILLEYCADIDKSNMRYIEKVAIEWAERGIDSMEKATEYIEKKEEKNEISKKFKRLLKISGRDLSDAEYVHIIQWTRELKMSPEMIKAAYEKTVMTTGSLSFPYMNAILISWHKQGIKEVSDIKKESAPAPVKEKPVRKNKFTDYEQTGSYDIDKLERRALEKRLANLKKKQEA